MLRSPREKFLVSPFKAEWEKIVSSPEFEEATLVALLQLQTELPEPETVARDWDQGSRLAGARRYLQILTSLHKPTEKTEPPKHPQLDYEAGV